MRLVPQPRALPTADTLVALPTEVDGWVASADETGNAQLVPLAHYWDGTALVGHSRAMTAAERRKERSGNGRRSTP